MKYIKLLSLLVAVLFLGACSDDDVKKNSAADVTVSMGTATISPRESAGIVSLPIKVEGPTNGMVTLTVETREVGSNPAVENTNYYVTTKKINITGSEGYVELEMVDDDEINDPRSFEVTIVKVEHAKLNEAAKTTSVVIRDNDHEPYDRLQGTWTLTYKNYDGAVQRQKVTITGADDPSEYIYNKLLYLEGMLLDKSKAHLSFNFDTANNTCYVSFTNFMKYNWVTGFKHPSFSDPIDIKLGRLEGQQISQSPIEGVVQADFKTIKFEEGATIAAIFTNPKDGRLNLIETMSDIVLTKE
jgi:major membrane immunogen (membrane-anchored lipoprotein)